MNRANSSVRRVMCFCLLFCEIVFVVFIVDFNYCVLFIVRNFVILCSDYFEIVFVDVSNAYVVARAFIVGFFLFRVVVYY